ncbi:MAG TPA: hypothetical protein VGK37_15975 [Casimicrobiaceae bacterium]
MNTSELDQLMNTMLDGEATPAEAGELDRRLAADPAARERFEELKRLFDGLGRVPKAFPPEGLVAAVMAAAPRRPVGRRRLRQLFAGSGVIRQVSMGPRGTSPGSSARVHQLSQPGPQQRGYKMNQQRNGLIGKRSVWIGAGIAAVAVVLVLQYVDFPPGSKDVSGTIVPAQRYRSTQSPNDDVKGGLSGTSPTDTGAGGANAGGANAGGANSGGANAGGANSGGANSGGANSGGANSGGANSGGANAGGANSGGANSGGANSGGANSGGANSGGANAGGANSGGANSGGANSGGANSGGANSGGANSGGANSGGANSGGANSGGANSGGANSGGANSGGANAVGGH